VAARARQVVTFRDGRIAGFGLERG
jgi:hypothetical protein